MRKSKLLRQGQTVYISTVHWNSKYEFYYYDVYPCLITFRQHIKNQVFVYYESYKEAFAGLPIRAGYLPATKEDHEAFFSYDGVQEVCFTKNKAIKNAQHRVMLLNFNIEKSVNDEFITSQGN